MIQAAALSLAAVCVDYLSQLHAEQVANPPEASVVLVILAVEITPSCFHFSLLNLDQSGSLISFFLMTLSCIQRWFHELVSRRLLPSSGV